MDATTINDAATMRGGLGSVLGRIDQYELVRELGGGGFGTVYLAKDTVAGIDVAVKGLPPMIKNNAEELERIRENFALVSRLHHPYIAAALHLQLARDVAYRDESVRQKLRVMPGDTLMVMEYAPGVTLSKWRKQFPGGIVPLDVAIQLAWQIAQALDYAHEQHIIHRDIKPSNIMVETKPDGEVVARLLDFGLAAAIRSSMGRVSQEVHDTSGTRPYMAPEQWAGRKQGPATDQYALAVLLCELLTGEVPFASAFETGDPIVMMTAVCNREVELPNDCPRKAALRKALAKDSSGRFASCMEFVEAATKSERVTPQGWGTWVASRGGNTQINRKIDNRAGAWIAVAAVVVIAVVGGIIWSVQWQRQVAYEREQERIAAERRAEEARLRAEAEWKAKEEARRKEQVNEIRIAAENKAKAEATEIRIEAKVQQGKVERISDADGFKARKDSLEDVFIRAEALYDDSARHWAEAKALYGDYIEQSKSVISLDGERQAAVAKRSEVQASFKKAEEAGAKTYARDSWNAAVKTWNAAAAEFGRMEFAAASGTFANALREFEDCAIETRNTKRIADEKRAEEKRMAEERATAQRRREELARQTEARRRQDEEERKAQEAAARKKAEAERLAGVQQEEAQLKAENGAKWCEAETERARQARSIVGKWRGGFKTSSSGPGAQTHTNECEYDFKNDGTYRAEGTYWISWGDTRNRYTETGCWDVSGDRLTLRKRVLFNSINGVSVNEEDYTQVVLWRPDGFLEFREDIGEFKKRNNLVNVYYESDGTLRWSSQIPGVGVIKHTRTPYVFKRVSD